MDQKPGLKLYQVLLLFSLFWITIILLGNLAVQIGKDLRYSLENDLLVSGVIYFIGFILSTAVGVYIFKVPFQPPFSWKLVRPALYPVLAVTLIGMAIIASELDNLIRLSVPIHPTTGQSPSPDLWQIILVSVIMLPIAMELFFRGYLLQGLLADYSEEVAVLSSGIISGLFFPVPNIIILGLLSGWVYARTRTLIPSLFMALFNFSLPVVFEFTRVTIPGFNTDSSIPQLQPLWFDGVGAALFFLGICLLIRLYGKARQENQPNGGAQ